MKRLKFKSLLLQFVCLVLIMSCSDEEDGIPGLGKYSGNYRLTYVNNSTTCTNSGTTTPSTWSENDIEIYTNGRFKRKIYALNSNDECAVSEIIEGKITIEGSYESIHPFGKVEYDNSNENDDIHIWPKENGSHNQISIDKNDGSQSRYYRTE